MERPSGDRESRVSLTIRLFSLNILFEEPMDGSPRPGIGWGTPSSPGSATPRVVPQ